ncbi:chemotaxis protein CheB [Sphingomicrobium arenosum]|uniref:chemotaxis protein CheB n=1 Tax=Sphingomicrobium arenosum TaxID=2233861 RepID=UPI00223FE224|nr:chemotaxis protein CheB [Sphingomicrobium arenosum]
MRRQDLIAIGGSAGAIPALVELLENFAPDTGASLFVVIHRAAESQHLKSIVERASAVEVCEPEEGDPIRPNCVYLARPDCHMLIGQEHIHLRRGPRENNFRPAIDPLFRSLAVFGSTRSAGVILSGYLDDGAAGCRAIASTGGEIFVQDPAEALSGQMPRAAISAVGEPEAVTGAADLGRLLSDWAGREAAPPVKASEAVKLEMLIAGLEKASMRTEEKLGELSPYNCPDCNGVLWEIEDGELTRYRCHTGHAYTRASLDERQNEALEHTLYDSLRALREKVEMFRQLARKEPEHEERWLTRAKDYQEDAETIESMLLDR